MLTNGRFFIYSVLVPVKTVLELWETKEYYENLVSLRAVTSVDGMTADWYKMPYDILSEISSIGFLYSK